MPRQGEHDEDGGRGGESGGEHVPYRRDADFRAFSGPTRRARLQSRRDGARPLGRDRHAPTGAASRRAGSWAGGRCPLPG